MEAEAAPGAAPTKATGELADFVTSLSFSDIPDSTVGYAKILLADTLGAGLYGSTTDVARMCWEFAARTGAVGPAAVWGRPEGLTAESAALVNGTQSHAYELDDYHPGAKLHPGSVVVPAALAVAAESPDPVTGRELLTAIVAGYDAMIRVSLAASSAAVRRRGWHLTGLAGPFGAAAAASRIAGHDRATTLHALGIAGSHSSGLFAFSREGSMTKRLHAGLAARGGVSAATLAALGFTGPSDVLEADDGGWFRAVSDEADPGRLVDGLGRSFAIDGTAIKPYACCGSLHSSIDAVLRLVTDHDLGPADIAEIVALNSTLVDQQCGYTYRGTGGALEAQMSLQYCLAVAAVDRQVFTEQFGDERRADPVVRDLASRVRFEVDPEIEAIYPRRFPARVRIRTTGGATHEEWVDAPTGSADTPYTWDQMTAKFTSTTSGVLAEAQRTALLDRVVGLESEPDVRGLDRLG